MADGSIDGLSFERLSSGEPLVLIHGTGSWRSALRPVVHLLADHHELILVDLPGLR
jgi:pimeloyl-ACP methyl ester carboxylesterase